MKLAVFCNYMKRDTVESVGLCPPFLSSLELVFILHSKYLLNYFFSYFLSTPRSVLLIKLFLDSALCCHHMSSRHISPS